MARLRDEQGHRVRFHEDHVECLGDVAHDVQLVVDLEEAR